MGKRRPHRSSPQTNTTRSSPHARDRARTSARATTFALALLVVIAGTWAYSTSFRGVFVWDDGDTIVENQHLKSLWPLTQSMSAPPSSTVAGRPLAAFSLALNYSLAPAEARDVMAPAGPQSAPGTAELFYRNIWGYHAFNLVIHLLAALTLAGVLRRTLERLDAFKRLATPLAFAIALLWAVHPLQTESVTYIVQRVESLMGLFYLLTLYCAIRAWEPGPGRTWWIAGAIAACTGGMATKEVMVTAPVIVVLWDWIFADPSASFRDLRQRRWPLYLGLAAAWIPLGILAAGLPRLAAAGYGYGWTWWSYLITQAGIITQYLRLSLCPTPLVFDYGWPPASSLMSVAPQIALLAGLAAVTTWLVVRRRPAGFLGAWLFLILAPSSSVIPIASEVAAEHRMYLPLASVLTFVVVGSAWLFTRWAASRTRGIAVAGLVMVAGLAIALATMTRERNRDYWNNEELWKKTVSQRPSNARAHAVYAVSLLSRGQYGDAESHLREAIRLDGSQALAYRNLGIALCATQRTAECIGALGRAISLEPASGESRGLLGEAYLADHQSVRATQQFLQALDLLPDNRASRFLLNRTAWLLATLPDSEARNGPKAVELAERGVSLTGRRDARLLDTLGAAYAETGRFPEAAMVAREALALAESDRDSALVSEINQHLAAFNAGRKLRQSPQ